MFFLLRFLHERKAQGHDLTPEGSLEPTIETERYKWIPSDLTVQTVAACAFAVLVLLYTVPQIDLEWMFHFHKSAKDAEATEEVVEDGSVSVAAASGILGPGPWSGVGLIDSSMPISINLTVNNDDTVDGTYMYTRSGSHEIALSGTTTGGTLKLYELTEYGDRHGCFDGTISTTGSELKYVGTFSNYENGSTYPFEITLH